ncbi:hypothetical protein GS399_13255 [Pedobacter sp. HMF7647]|uniref:Uncharacterized protein n=1 Tax=Hufsiella arboris TaxID=2695275 RepID=A0A7K1YBI0_9SPHI|nr:hypothetical protein [Hufsiella arboris]MXV51944.1 hypothetical protein [Hufsiella arboris]
MIRYLFFLLNALILFSCKPRSTVFPNGKPSFEIVKGKHFIEVSRRFPGGLSFNKDGYMLKPEWDLFILNDSTVRIYSPFEKAYVNYPYFFDHDSVFNMARTWLRLKYLTKDSMMFQILRVANKEISRTRSNAYMKFYSESYINDSLHTTAQKLKQPPAADSLYIRQRTMQAAKIPDSAFIAIEPVTLTSKSPIIRVEKILPETGPLSDDKTSDFYLLPEFKIMISKAYRDFHYEFSVFVDAKGVMHFNRSEIMLSDDFAEHYQEIMKGVMSVYLQNLLTITPGKTLGIPHTSMIIVDVTGKKQG